MKKANKKSAKEASNAFHNIMAASVKENPKPKVKEDVKVKDKKEDADSKKIYETNN